MTQDRNFNRLLQARWDQNKFLCVGLDTDLGEIARMKIPGMPSDDVLAQMSYFNQHAVMATSRAAAAYKLNFAFYLGEWPDGLQALYETVRFIQKHAPEVPIILDTKWNDIGNTNKGYVKYAFDILGVDALTLNAYMGEESLLPFLRYPDKGFFILCKTSNPGSAEFQDLELKDGTTLYQRVAKNVSAVWENQELGNLGLVVGATYPEELKIVRRIAPGLPILLPGVGSQAGDLAQAVRNGQNKRGSGFLVNSSRGILYPKVPEGRSIEQSVGFAADDLSRQISKSFRA
ncbi:MAG: orotidine-5'-phosphate decarboxylase [Patescibacteria group bacterium]